MLDIFFAQADLNNSSIFYLLKNYPKTYLRCIDGEYTTLQHRKSRSPSLRSSTEVEPDRTISSCPVTKMRAVFTVVNPKGLHTRPSTELAKCASSFRSRIVLRYQKIVVNAKSLLGILTLAAGKGSRITVEAQGEDAPAAIEALLRLAQNHFFVTY